MLFNKNVKTHIANGRTDTQVRRTECFGQQRDGDANTPKRQYNADVLLTRSDFTRLAYRPNYFRCAARLPLSRDIPSFVKVPPSPRTVEPQCCKNTHRVTTVFCPIIHDGFFPRVIQKTIKSVITVGLNNYNSCQRCITNPSINVDGRVTVAMQANRRGSRTNKIKRVSSYNILHQTHVHQPTIPPCHQKVSATKDNNVCDLTTKRFPRFSYFFLVYEP
jgi:hypothetical protein